MLVKEAMCAKPVWLPPSATLKEAATKMEQLDCGFIPVGENDKLIGTVTDRDMVLRAICKGKDINKTALRDVMSTHIEYCFEDDDLNKAAKKMTDKQIHRLLVLNKKKRLTGILSLGDITRKTHDDQLVGETVEGILTDGKKPH